MIKNINPEIAKKWLENGEACLIDVREPSENKSQAIENSLLIPLGQFEQNKIPEKLKGRKIIIHCQKGGRASKACEKLIGENPNLDVYNLEGGILNWVACGLATKNDQDLIKPTMSLERQVRLTAGLLVFIGCILTVFVSEAFVAIPTFVGFGLMFTAIIDWCGMAKILSMMPWNK